MDSRLAEFLRRRTPLRTDRFAWANGTMPLTSASYACGCDDKDLPPLHLITSVRAVVFDRDGRVLVLRNRDGVRHCVPGGRREPHDQTLVQTLRREVLEETRWNVQIRRLLGFTHMHHLGEKPTDYAFPHPDFIWLVYLARATTHDPAARRGGDYEQSAELATADQVGGLEFDGENRLWLDLALGRTPVPR
jgi:ADP-ribose pyrophosphatase YjhB (NUDIX family)